MNRIFLAAALLAALPPYAAGAKPRPMHRLNPAPGFSVDVPDGFAGCDAATNKRLGNAPHLVVLNEFCASEAHHPELDSIVNLDPAVPLMMVMGYSPKYAFPEKVIAAATPEIYAILKEEVCGRILKGYIPSSSCSVGPGTLAGHSAFVVEGKVQRAKGQPAVVRGYLLTRGDGLAAFMFGAPSPVDDKVQAAMNRILASVKVEDLPPPPPPEIVQLDALGLKLSVPKGWIGCDPQHDTLLGQAKDPFGNRDTACRNLDPAKQVLIYDPHLPVATFIHVGRENGQSDVDAFVRDLEPAALAARRDKECADMAAQFTLKNLVTKSCDTRAGTIAGEPAEIVEFEGSGMGEGERVPLNLHARMTVVVRKNEVFTVSLTANSPFEPAIGSDAEAIVSSAVLPAEP
ncbi:MAG: hypothetical protein JOZ72_04365 [Alphaproteobacteria bacterium]|nr:hypothetical protein [Alphaproteobacteria bacterium]